MKILYSMVLTSIILFLITCSSQPVMVSKAPRENYTRLGNVRGSACGSMFVISTAYNFIPIMLNSRVERAYDEAMSTYPETRALINVTISEDWYWYILGTARCTTLRGVAVK